MRAKLLLAAALLVTAFQPVFSHNLVREVRNTLYPDVRLVNGCEVRTLPAVISDGGCMALPAVVAATNCGAALLMRDPSDLDIRREALIRKINCLSAAGALNACDVQTLGAAMQEVNQAEISMRSNGDLTNLESHRLFKAMDRIGTDADWLSRRSMIGPNSYIGMSQAVRYE